MIGVVFPSRGLVYSRTAEELLKNLKGLDYKIFFSHRKPIPDCFNEPTEKALGYEDLTHIWFVEDDMILPPRVLKTMLKMDKAVVTADYPVNKEGKGAVFKDADGKVLFCGTGCTLVKAEVFRELKVPFFRTDKKWNVKNMGDYIKFSSVENTNGGYGLHDINFCFRLHELGIPIHVIKQKLGQRKLVNLGKSGTNNGAHNIEEWHTVKKDFMLKKIQSWPVQPSGNLVAVSTPTGIVNTSEEHAKKLIKKGLAKEVPKTASIIE